MYATGTQVRSPSGELLGWLDARPRGNCLRLLEPPPYKGLAIGAPDYFMLDTVDIHRREMVQADLVDDWVRHRPDDSPLPAKRPYVGLVATEPASVFVSHVVHRFEVWEATAEVLPALRALSAFKPVT